ncbi:unnamed protein product [Darwinula stevensoni]|uniref:C-type lectin domain-containing protein n=1 Tax=Darwinula stevensoni TaxID=69355 RepID=A0A7R9A5M1_9CRUS|nr:unnamed protein product [Darwinula stevensoni]CAG0892351.1 unnamed protein product [Darwinula stevensoni]
MDSLGLWSGVSCSSTASVICGAIGPISLPVQSSGVTMADSLPRTYQEAKAACATVGAQLFEVRSSNQQTSATNTLQQLEAQTLYTDAWIGVNDIQLEGNVVGENTGTALTETFFALPDMNDINRNCVALIKNQGYAWEFRDCNTRLVFLCYFP